MKKILLLSILSVFFGMNCSTPEVAELFSVFMDQMADLLLDNDQAMGIFAVEKNGSQSYTKSIGKSNLASSESIDENSLFRIADISNVMTAVMIYRLAEASELALSDNLFQRGFNFPNANRITINHLLQHTSGVKNLLSSNDFSSYRNTVLNGEQLDNKLNTSGGGSQVPLVTPNYNPTNFIFLSRIIEKITGKSYKAAFDSLIVKPLQLSNTQVESATFNSSKQVKYYNGDKRDTSEINYSILLGAGAVISNAKELNRFCSQLFTNRGFLSARYLDSLKVSTRGIHVVGTADDNSELARNTKFGKGIFEFVVHNQMGYGSFGDGAGVKTMVMYFPERKASICFLLNYLKSSVTQESIADSYLSTYFIYSN